MARGLSIHVGLNGVDPNAYGGWDGQLAGCLNDARAMQSIAQSVGYQPQIILDQQATAAAVTSAIKAAAGMLQSGDILLLTYSGHGGQVPDPTGEEPTGMNSTWVLYDRMMVDDELYALWAHFQTGVRIFVLSDSCHSGTVTREMQYQYALAGNEPLSRAYRANARKPKFRNMPLQVNQKHYLSQRRMYDVISTYTPKDLDLRATVLLISGCQDNQLSADGANNGLFTEKLLQVWNKGAFQGAYFTFRNAIVAEMPPTQCPNYYVVGTSNSDFEGQQPFSISGGAQQGGGDQGGGGWGDQGGGGEGDQGGGWGDQGGGEGDQGGGWGDQG
jgi:hypothetical protein